VASLAEIVKETEVITCSLADCLNE